MQCPVCPNVALQMTDRQGVEIDYCPNCRGVWLDRGELDKIIERASAVDSGGHRRDTGERPAPAFGLPRFDRDDDDDDRYRGGKRRKRGGFLGELFDFD